jgi:hypothetical protein
MDFLIEKLNDHQRALELQIRGIEELRALVAISPESDVNPCEKCSAYAFGAVSHPTDKGCCMAPMHEYLQCRKEGGFRKILEMWLNKYSNTVADLNIGLQNVRLAAGSSLEG